MEHSSSPSTLQGRHAVVTGVTGPIGVATAAHLLRLGARVSIVGHHETTTRTAAARLGVGDPDIHWADLTDPDAVSALAVDLGDVDGLVCAAGGGGRPCALGDMSLPMWRSTFATNVETTLLCLQALVPTMVRRGHGAVVVVNSDAALAPTRASIAYAAAKAAVLALTNRVAADVSGGGVRVNTIAPGTVRTAEIHALPQTIREQLEHTHPSGRLGTPEEIAACIAFLLDDTSDWLTGQTITPGARNLH